ncbi:hypothetical protein [Kutzneria buriramensis]|uniref:Uncharacterized protein n=1 Tax=Kutzneria buriramensis TaxID=1045776 RepID=A0A3E0H0I8_9PSEU|nr:hypothetical protein [Kutzneria buriramensis]REH36141.1 hypothetical protein BCF44_11610 [Kutzneria buriramensis]
MPLVVRYSRIPDGVGSLIVLICPAMTTERIGGTGTRMVAGQPPADTFADYDRRP